MAKNYRASLRKSGASGKKKAPTVFPSARTPALRHNEGAPLSTSSQPCNSTALAPRTFVHVHDLPSQNSRPNGGCCPTASQPFRSFPCAHSAVRGGFCPSSFYAAPWRILAFTTRSHTTSQNSNLCNSAKLWENSFAKYRTLRKNPQTQCSCGFADIYFQNNRFWKCLLTFWTTCYILYSSQILSVFAKYDTLRNFWLTICVLSHIIGIKRQVS